MEQQGNFFQELLGTVTDTIDFAGDSLQNAAANAVAITNINNAQAAAITEASKRKTVMMQNVMKIVVLAIVCITVVSVLYIGLKK